MLQSPLHSLHESHGAHFVDFAGWQLPIRYGSIVEEHQQTRRSGSLFDVSHMARLKFTGRHARRLLETALTRQITSMKPMTCRYSLICNEAGGILDDVIVYRFDDHWMMVANAANREKVLAHLQAIVQTQELSCQIEDQTASTAMVAIQGPKVLEMVGKFSKELPTIPRYSFRVKNLMILKLIASRTGYTGEDGLEIMMPAKMAGMALKLLMKESSGQEATVKPAGLGARDTLRLEAGMPLYGHELSEQIDPLSAGLDFAVSLNKGPSDDEGPVIPRFIGQDALEAIAAKGPEKKCVGLRLQGKRTARQGMAVCHDGATVGEITSGCLSPTLGYPIAMAYVGAALAQAGTAVQVTLDEERHLDAEVVSLPFYKRPA